MGELLVLLLITSPILLALYLHFFPTKGLVALQARAKRNRIKKHKAWATRNRKKNAWYSDKNLFK